VKNIFLPIKFTINFLFVLVIFLISTKLFNLLFQNKYYKSTKDLNENDIKNIQDNLELSVKEFQVPSDYKHEYLKILNYFKKFDKLVIFDKNKSNPQYKNLKYLFHVMILAKEALSHLEQVTANNKKFAYYESNKNASIETLIKHFTKKLIAKNENKISTKQAKNEVKIKRFIAKLKKHDTLFINFYLMLYTMYPISKLDFKKEDEEYIELFQDIFEFYSIGHTTEQQIYKSIAIQIYKIYEPYITKIEKDTATTEQELKENISLLIDYIFDTHKPYKNFNNINEEAYVKNIIYRFPLFECDNLLQEKQIKRFRFYFVSKNTLVPKYVPKFLRRYFSNKFLKSPLIFYRTSTLTTLFGLIQKKI